MPNDAAATDLSAIGRALAQGLSEASATVTQLAQRIAELARLGALDDIFDLAKAAGKGVSAETKAHIWQSAVAELLAPDSAAPGGRGSQPGTAENAQGQGTQNGRPGAAAPANTPGGAGGRTVTAEIEGFISGVLQSLPTGGSASGLAKPVVTAAAEPANGVAPNATVPVDGASDLAGTTLVRPAATPDAQAPANPAARLLQPLMQFIAARGAELQGLLNSETPATPAESTTATPTANVPAPAVGAAASPPAAPTSPAQPATAPAAAQVTSVNFSATTSQSSAFAATFSSGGATTSIAASNSTSTSISFSATSAAASTGEGLEPAAAEALTRRITDLLRGLASASSGSRSNPLRTDLLDSTRAWATQLLGNGAGGLNAARPLPAAVPAAGASAATSAEGLLTPDELSGFDAQTQTIIRFLEAIDPEATPQLRNTLRRLARFMGDAGAAARNGGRDPIGMPAMPNGRGAVQAMAEQGFTFEIEISHTQVVERAAAQLTENGVQVQVERVESASLTRLRVTVGGAQRSDPVVLDLNRNGEIELRNPDAGAAPNFDINADGRMDRSAMVAGGDAFLALDVNNDGRINDGRELFGDQNGARNGMDELGRYDLNADRMINYQDPVFTRLVAWYDVNRDGMLGSNETKPLSELGIQRLMLEYKPIEIIRPDGNAMSGTSWMDFDDGRSAEIVDVELLYS